MDYATFRSLTGLPNVIFLLHDLASWLNTNFSPGTSTTFLLLDVNSCGASALHCIHKLDVMKTDYYLIIKGMLPGHLVMTQRTIVE